LVLIVFRELTNSKHVGSGMMGKCTGYQDTVRKKPEKTKTPIVNRNNQHLTM